MEKAPKTLSSQEEARIKNSRILKETELVLEGAGHTEGGRLEVTKEQIGLAKEERES